MDTFNIDISDVKQSIYFISSLAQERMYGGLSFKSDLSGGIFDRWINIVSEGVIFNRYFLPKISDECRAISDYYRYRPLDSGIAPDLLGVRIGKREIPFAQFGNQGWEPYLDAPQIEVKTFKKDQYLVSLRNQHYEGKYLVLLEMNLDAAYLVSFISDDVLSDEIYSTLRMNDKIFIKNNTKYDIIQTAKVHKRTIIGTIKHIRTTTAIDFMNCCDLCRAKNSPVYIKSIEKSGRPFSNQLNIRLSDVCEKRGLLYKFNQNWYELHPLKNTTTLSWEVENINEIVVSKITKSSIGIKVLNDICFINGVKLLPHNNYLIKLSVLNRSGNEGEEYFMHKSVVNVTKDHEDEVIVRIKEHINKAEDIDND